MGGDDGNGGNDGGRKRWVEVLEGEVVKPLQYPTRPGPLPPTSGPREPQQMVSSCRRLQPVPTHAPHFTSTVTASSGLPEPRGKPRKHRQQAKSPSGGQGDSG